MIAKDFDSAFIDWSLERDYPASPPPEEQASMDGVQLAMGGRGGGRGSPLTMSDAGMALFDMGAGTLRGAAAQTIGLGGDIEMLGRGLRAIFNRPEDQSRIDAFLAGMKEKTRLATTEQVSKEGFRIPFTDVQVELPPVAPPGSRNEAIRTHSANVGQAFGELAPLPGAIDAGVKGVKAGARAVGQAIDQAMTQGTGPGRSDAPQPNQRGEIRQGVSGTVPDRRSRQAGILAGQEVSGGRPAPQKGAK